MRLHRGQEPSDDVWMQGLGTPLWVQFRQFTDDPAEIEAMVATYRAYNLAHHDEMVRPYDGVVEAVRALRDRGKTLGLVTSKMRSGAVRAGALAEHLGEPGALQLGRVGRAPALDPRVARAGGRVPGAAARRATRLQPVERDRPASRSYRGAVRQGRAGADPGHDRQRRGELRGVLAAGRARRQGRRHAAELPPDLGARPELRRPGAWFHAARRGGVGALSRRGAERHRTGHETGRRHQSA